MTEFSTTPLEELADLSGGFAFKSKDYAETGRFILRTLNITDDGTINKDQAIYLPLDLCPNYKRFELQENDTLFVMVGATLGKIGWIQAQDLPALLNQNMWRIRAKPNLVDPRFLNYAFRIASAKSLNWASGSARAFVRRDDYRKLSIPSPPILTQRAISNLLGALDDQIENNRQMNQTLEEMARAIFKSWFVDFDPIHAKAAGNAPAHMDAETATLFPSSFGDDGLPVGWVKATLGDIAKNPKRTVKPDEVDDSTPYIGLEHMPRNSIALDKWGSAGRVSSNKSKFEKGEFLFGKLRPYFHKVGITAVSGICSTDILIVQPNEEWWTGTTISCISSLEFVNYTNQNSTGTKMPRTNWKDMSRYEITLPDKKAAHSFNSLVVPMLEKITNNIKENQTLTELRDTLLPKLMSGEIRVKDAEREVEAAV